MSPEAAMMLEQSIVPIISATVPRVCRPVRSEDPAELVQDTILTAARMIHAAECAGKPLIARSIAHYAIETTRSGRRALSNRRTDALGAGARMDARSIPVSIDGSGESGDGDGSTGSWLDLLADGGEDPSVAAARRLDWEELVRGLDARDREILGGLQAGERQNLLARRLGISAARVCQLRDRLRERIAGAWGDTDMVLRDVVAEPCWGYGMRAGREREAARWDRKQEEEQEQKPEQSGRGTAGRMKAASNA